MRSTTLLCLAMALLLGASPVATATRNISLVSPAFDQQALECRLIASRFLGGPQSPFPFRFFGLLKSLQLILPRPLVAETTTVLSAAFATSLAWHPMIVGLAGVIWNGPVRRALSDRDAQLLEQFPAQNLVHENRLLSTYAHQLTRSRGESKNPHQGRSIQLTLQHPFSFLGRRITHLRLKGVRYFPTVYAPQYENRDHFTDFDTEGRLVSKATASDVLGGVLRAAAEREFNIMQAFHAQGMTDVPVLWGEYPFRGLPHEIAAGYVVAAMEGEDRRLRSTSLAAKPDAEEALGWESISNRSSVFSVQQTDELVFGLGATIRLFHAGGYFHNSLRLLNIGLTLKGGTACAILRDLENGVARGRLSKNLEERLPQAATARLLDLERVIRDLAASGHAFTGSGGRVIAALIEGYFGTRELPDFEEIVRHAKDPRFSEPFLRLENRHFQHGRLLSFDPRVAGARTAALWRALAELPGRELTGLVSPAGPLRSAA